MYHLKNILYLNILVYLVLLTPAESTIIYVQEEYSTIQEGIDAANNGDTVLVEEDIYFENIEYMGKTILVTSYFMFDADTHHIDSTIIDGSGTGTVVIFQTSEGLNSIIMGFTIQNGNATWGGGIRCIGSSPTITNCIIRDNTANWGAGIHSFGATSPLITNCYITGNTAIFDGGGVGCDSSVPQISDCIFFQNTGGAGGGGGAIAFHWGSNPHITKCVFSQNTAGEGGGVFCLDSDPTISYCIFVKNEATGFSAGGGLQGRSAHPTVTNCTFTENIAMLRGGGINFKYYTHAEITNCILWNDTPEEIYAEDGDPIVTYCDVQDGWTGTGNIDAHPLFVDSVNGDYHLSWVNFPIEDSTKSPCIDAGDPNFPFDPDSTIADMGAFYFSQEVGIREERSKPITFYRGPTIFSGPLMLPANMNYTIYDITGRTVDANHLVPGVYFLEIEDQITNKVIKIR
jgi:hypothetical protein